MENLVRPRAADPGDRRWSRSSEWSRRESAAQDLRRAARPRARVPPGPRCASSASAASGVSSQTPARFFEPASVRTSSAPSWKREPERRCLRPLLAGPQVAQPAGATSGARAARARRRRSGTAAASRGARRRPSRRPSSADSGGSNVFSVATCAGPAFSIGKAPTRDRRASGATPPSRAARASSGEDREQDVGRRGAQANRIVSVSPSTATEPPRRRMCMHRDRRAEVAQVLAEHDRRRGGRDRRDAQLGAVGDDRRPARGRRAGARTGRAPRPTARRPRRRRPTAPSPGDGRPAPAPSRCDRLARARPSRPARSFGS